MQVYFLSRVFLPILPPGLFPQLNRTMQPVRRYFLLPAVWRHCQADHKQCQADHKQCQTVTYRTQKFITCSQDFVTGLYAEPVESIPHPAILFNNNNNILPMTLRSSIHVVTFLEVYSAKLCPRITLSAVLHSPPSSTAFI